MSLINEIMSIAKVLQQAGKIDLYEKLMNISETALILQDQNTTLRKENSKLKEELKIKDSIKFENDAYWLINKEGEITEGPFCPKCYDDEKLLMHLITMESVKEEFYNCPKCNLNREKNRN